MTKAKHLHGTEKSDAVKKSFDNKLAKMAETLKRWRRSGERDDSFWPESLAQLKSWHSPTDDIFEWKSNNVTKRDGKYAAQVQLYWSLRERALQLPKTALGDNQKIEPSRWKKENVRLAQQITQLTWEIMDLRDELVRIDPKNSLLARMMFP
ncbi:hypothetical protein [Agrobacterium sp.]|uniref:hypothetical protein n=1 Tax=Agrobacterium sp. TaxID=361 RepID=UPI0028B107CD